MNRSVKWLLSAVVSMSVFLFVGNLSYAEGVPDDKINVAIEFEKAEYLPGETAKASVKITGVGDEAEAGYKLGAFETHIKFDDTKLEFRSGSFNASLEVADTDTREIGVATDTDISDIVITAFHSMNGVTISADEGEFIIAELTFDILSSAAGEAAVGIETLNYVSVFELPQSAAFKELKCIPAEDVKINIADYIIESSGAVASDTEITDSVTVRVKDGIVANAWLMAGLYEKDGWLLLSPIVMKNVGVDEAPYNITIEKPAAADGKQLEIRYYLWNGTALISPLASPKSAAVN